MKELEQLDLLVRDKVDGRHTHYKFVITEDEVNQFGSDQTTQFDNKQNEFGLDRTLTNKTNTFNYFLLDAAH